MGRFFKLLKINMGSAGYRRFMRDLADYLGGYLLFFRKSSPEFAKLRGKVNYSVMAYLIGESDFKMMKWFYSEMPWKVDYLPSVLPKTEEILIWCLHNGILNVNCLISQAARNGNYFILESCVKRKLIPKDAGWIYRGVNDPAVLDYLWENGFKPGGNDDTPFDNGFDSCLNLESYSWYLSRAFLCPGFDYSKWLENRSPNFKWKVALKNLMFNIPNPPLFVAESIIGSFFNLSGEDTLIPLDICQEMPYQYAIQLDSDACECDDPKNHEERKRRKTHFA